jgi:hypothetical protein
MVAALSKILSFTLIDKRNDLGDGLVDLSHPIIDYKSRVEIVDLIIVSEEYAGRPWAISKVYYDTESYSDLLCHFNGISNPFALQPGTTLAIPRLSSMLAAISTYDPSSISFDTFFDEVTPENIRAVLESNEALAFRPGVLATPPNVADTGVPNETNNGDGTITLGTNSTVGICSAEGDTATRTLGVTIRNAVIQLARASGN